MGEHRRSGPPSRRAKKSHTATRMFARLGLEALEQRRLLHAGHEDEDMDPQVFELLGAVPEPPPADPAATTSPLSSIPALSSLPNATAKLYLDFDGYFESIWGSYSSITTPAYDQDGNPNSFTDGELQSIADIWAQVAEDYAPFNINVTTVEPSSFANGVAVRVAIGGGGSWSGGTYGGIAYVNSFTNSNANTVYVFPNNLNTQFVTGYAKYVADASSHEAGHSFGLQHQSQYDANGAKINEYYAGSGGRAPIMGNSYGATRGLWWYGTSTSASTFQDDLAVISRPTNLFGYRADDHGNTAAAATPLAGSGSLLTGSGILTSTSDVDYFSFDTAAGQVTLSVTVPAGINNLDSKLELRTAAGALITSAAPSNSFNATITTTLAAGSYRLVVASQGNYDDIGQYTVTASVQTPVVPPSVLARKIFYNQSLFDNDSAAIASADDAAIATNKVAYLPGGGTAAANNVTSYARGINGIMVDLAGTHGPLTTNDFTFRMSAKGLAVNNSPGSWTAAPSPSGFSVRATAGTSGSDRVEIVWPAGTIVDRWLEVIVEGNDAVGGFNTNTGLAASDVFFFGNKIGDTFTFGEPGAFGVDVTDQLLVRSNQGTALSVTSIFDFSRDGLVDATDQLIARNNQGYLLAINISAPLAPPQLDSGTESAVASALAVPRAEKSLAAAGSIAARPALVETAELRSSGSSPLATWADDPRRQARDKALDELADSLVLDDELLDRLAKRT
jgi:Metallo-peptidase family M12B Reprolysin-like